MVMKLLTNFKMKWINKKNMLKSQINKNQKMIKNKKNKDLKKNKQSYQILFLKNLKTLLMKS